MNLVTFALLFPHLGLASLFDFRMNKPQAEGKGSSLSSWTSGSQKNSRRRKFNTLISAI